MKTLKVTISISFVLLLLVPIIAAFPVEALAVGARLNNEIGTRRSPGLPRTATLRFAHAAGSNTHSSNGLQVRVGGMNTAGRNPAIISSLWRNVPPRGSVNSMRIPGCQLGDPTMWFAEIRNTNGNRATGVSSLVRSR